MKRFLCILLTAMMIVSAAALTAQADEEYRVNAYGDESGGSDNNIPRKALHQRAVQSAVRTSQHVPESRLRRYGIAFQVGGRF